MARENTGDRGRAKFGDVVVDGGLIREKFG